LFAITNRGLKIVPLIIAPLLLTHLLIPNEHGMNKQFTLLTQTPKLLVDTQFTLKRQE